MHTALAIRVLKGIMHAMARTACAHSHAHSTWRDAKFAFRPGALYYSRYAEWDACGDSPLESMFNIVSYKVNAGVVLTALSRAFGIDMLVHCMAWPLLKFKFVTAQT